MSLMRLLSVSRSFCSSIPEMGRYKLSRRGALPDFGRRANRGLVPRRATQAEFEMESAASATFKPKEVESVLSASPGVGVREALGGSLASGDRRMAAAEGGPGGRVGRLGAIWGRFLEWARSCGVGRGGGRRLRRQPVQTAFSLESVRVVRNDLADADLELVSLKSRRRVRLGGPTDGEGGWDVDSQRPLARIAAKLFTAGRSG